MAFIPFNGTGGGGAGSEECTALASHVRAGYTAIVNGSNDEPVNGTLQTYSESSTITPSLIQQSINCGGKYVSGNITVNAIPNQKDDTGTRLIDTTTQSYTYPVGYYKNAHGVRLETVDKTYTPNVTAQSETAPTGKVIKSVTVNAIPNQRSDSGNVRLNASTTSKSYQAGWYSNSHGADVELFVWS